MPAAAAARQAPAPAPPGRKAPHPNSGARAKARARAAKRPPGAKQLPKKDGRPKPGHPKMTVYKSNAALAIAQNAAGMIPVAAGRAGEAAGRAGVAVRELPDSGAILRLTRGRLWIGALGALLAGIVTLNVLSLGLNAEGGRTGQQIDALERDNSALRAEIAESLSSSKVEVAAADLGLAVPAPEEISYLTYSGSDRTRAGDKVAGAATSPAP